MMTGCPVRRIAALGEPDVDGAVHSVGGEGLAFVEQDAVFPGVGAGDAFAGHAHGAFGDGLGFAEPLDFFGVLGAAVGYAEIEIAGYVDAGLLDEFGVDEGEGAIGGDSLGAGAAETFGDGLGGGGFAVAGEAARGGVVGGAGDGVGAGVFAGAGHFDVAEDEDGFVLECDQRGGISDAEAHSMVERCVRVWNSGHYDGVEFGHFLSPFRILRSAPGWHSQTCLAAS